MVVPVQSAPIPEESAISLARYAAIIDYPECQFWGVAAPDLASYECRTIWLKSERDAAARYLAEAQEEIENIVGYPVGKKWFESERQRYKLPLLTKWTYVIGGGVKAVSVISADEAVNHATDPAAIGPVATTVTDEDEIKVFYPASLVEEDVEIQPSDIDLAGGFVTIYIPRCRMVHPSYIDNDRNGVPYADLTKFLSVVDVRRVYNDPSTNATLIWPHGRSNCDCVSCSCSETTQSGCIYVRDGRIGAVDVLPAMYSGGEWSSTSLNCCDRQPEYVLLSYVAGTDMTRQMEDAIVRLAHSKMPDEPCGCDVVQRLWMRDRKEPEVFTRERLNCPFGLNQGAWIAWKFVRKMRNMRASGL